MSPAEGVAALDDKEDLLRELAATEIHPVSGLFMLLDWADVAGIPMVAVTNAPRANANQPVSGVGDWR